MKPQSIELDGLEIYADFHRYYEAAFEAEPGNPNTRVMATEEVELKNITVYFGKTNVNILPLLSEAAKEEVISIIKQKSD